MSDEKGRETEKRVSEIELERQALVQDLGKRDLEKDLEKQNLGKRDLERDLEKRDLEKQDLEKELEKELSELLSDRDISLSEEERREKERKLLPHRYEVRVQTQLDPIVEETRAYRSIAKEVDDRYDEYMKRAEKKK
ncbi:hypothetical protein D3C76_289430 [compost metagenome]